MKGIKIVSAQEMARIEALAVQSGASEEEFIKQAGLSVAESAVEMIDELKLSKEILLLTGKGNNGADAFAAGLCLLEEGYQVRAFQLSPLESCSAFCKKFAERFRKKGGELIPFKEGLEFGLDTLIIDGLVGTGFSGKAEGALKAMIEWANRSKCPILAVDIPSGLNGSTGEADVVICARVTVALGLPKIGFFLRNGWNAVGELRIGDFGLTQEWVDQAHEAAWLPDWEALLQKIPKPLRNRHKYQAGFVVGYAGSSLYSGAAKLASFAALRSGAGIVKLFYKASAHADMVNAPYEVIRLPWNQNEWSEAVAKANALFIGPGIGQDEEALHWLAQHLKGISKPVVLDADALQPTLSFPQQSICTPHRGEMLRLLDVEKLDEPELLAQTRAFCEKKRVIVILKGAPTWIFEPGKRPSIIAHGDPGMATAGSGDVLTGILASLLAQGCSASDAALLGATLHALAGEAAAKEKTSHCMIASDLIEALPKVFQRITCR